MTFFDDIVTRGLGQRDDAPTVEAHAQYGDLTLADVENGDAWLVTDQPADLGEWQ